MNGASTITANITRNIPVGMPIIYDFGRKWKLKELSFFGSVLRDDFTPDSDIDVLVDYHEEHYLGIRERITAREELSKIVQRKVDWTTRKALEWHSVLPSVREEILDTAEVIYGYP